jgi:hypothetical protein
MRTAILVDGGFFLNRYRYLYSKGVNRPGFPGGSIS